MAIRETAYCHRSETIYEPDGDVTVEVYVLWPKGGTRSVCDLLTRVVADVRGEVLESETRARNVSAEKDPNR